MPQQLLILKHDLLRKYKDRRLKFVQHPAEVEVSNIDAHAPIAYDVNNLVIDTESIIIILY